METNQLRVARIGVAAGRAALRRGIKGLATFGALIASAVVHAQDAPTFDDFHAMLAERASVHAAELKASPFSQLTRDYFSRYTHDPDATPTEEEVAIDETWNIALPDGASETAVLMAGHLAEFFDTAMGLELVVGPNASATANRNNIALFETDGGDAEVPESFTIDVQSDRVVVRGRDAAGLRDGVVRLMDRIGFRQAPILTVGETTYRPRIAIRQGAHGSHRDTVLMGYNAILAGGGSLYAASKSEAIPELKARQVAGALDGSYAVAREARRYGLKTYFHMGTQEKFAKDAPVFQAHPGIRGALTWKEDGDYTLCTEHPLVQQYLRESVVDIFEGDPQLDGITIIIGGEGFYHCYMRPYGVEKGHTNCQRCEPLGAAQVVANLCNLVADAARSVNPEAQVLAWPYSAAHVWSADAAQTEFIAKLKPGVTILTEIVKDETVEKPEGIRKALWDYSIDLIGPGERAKSQLAACRNAGIPLRLLGMAEETFEASLLPHIPAMDRWADRAEAFATCGADSIYVFQMGPYDATSAAEVNKHLWWEPAPDKESFLQMFAARIGGHDAGPHIRDAWRSVSDAIDFSPEIGPYYQGTHYLGPMHPMCADVDAEVPAVFYGYYLFYAEITAADAFKGRPTFHTKARGDAPVFERYYRRMEERLKHAADEMDRARPLVPDRCRLMFDAEDYPVQWFYRTARTSANFYESCRLRDQLAQWGESLPLDDATRRQAVEAWRRWRVVLLDEQANAEAALPIMLADVRLDPYHRGDHSLSKGEDMLREKLSLLDQELNVVLPGVAARLGIEVE